MQKSNLTFAIWSIYIMVPILVGIIVYFIKNVTIYRQTQKDNNKLSVRLHKKHIVELTHVKKYGNNYTGFDIHGNKIKFTQKQIVNE